MSEIVFILGAGASRDAGGPLMNDFLEVAERLAADSAPSGPQLKADLELVREAVNSLQAVYAKSTLDLENIESIYGAFEMARLIGRFPGKTEPQIQELAHASRRLIVATLESSIRFQLKQGHLHPTDSYKMLARLVGDLNSSANRPRCTIITFNYDIALDYALHHESFPPDYCLADPIGYAHRSVPLLKLHGSINWGQCPKCGRVVPHTIEQHFKGKVFLPETAMISLRVSGEIPDLECCGANIGGLPVVVPPTWNKAEYQASLRCVWTRAAAELTEADRIIVCGYSLPETDIFFRYFYALGAIGPRRLRQFTVYDPDTRVDARYRSLLGGGAAAVYQHKPLPFQSAIAEVAQQLGPKRSRTAAIN